jgi:MFS family permease
MNDIYNRVVGSIANLYLTPFSPILASSTSFPYGSGQVAKSKLLHERFTNEQRATLSSLNSFLGSLLYGVFAIFFGILADVTQPNIAMFIGQLCLLPSFFIVVFLHKQKKI